MNNRERQALFEKRFRRMVDRQDRLEAVIKCIMLLIKQSAPQHVAHLIDGWAKHLRGEK